MLPSFRGAERSENVYAAYRGRNYAEIVGTRNSSRLINRAGLRLNADKGARRDVEREIRSEADAEILLIRILSDDFLNYS